MIAVTHGLINSLYLIIGDRTRLEQINNVIQVNPCAYVCVPGWLVLHACHYHIASYRQNAAAVAAAAAAVVSGHTSTDT